MAAIPAEHGEETGLLSIGSVRSYQTMGWSWRSPGVNRRMGTFLRILAEQVDPG